MAIRLFIANIDQSVTQDNLKGVISQIAVPSKVILVVDQKTKLPKGFGFAEFEQDEDGLKVIEELNGYVLNGKPLKISEDRSFSEKSDSPKSENLPNVQRVVFSFSQTQKRKIDLTEHYPISFKNTKILNQFLSQRGKILGRKYTGLSNKDQNEVAKAIKRARNFALIREPDMFLSVDKSL
ncbi:MAG: 30S ribosomal protein S18 [Deltaproteobacteria bacterium]|nr:30S ribosomal protein S18 [Deltaproteobacteria bacterium]